MSKWVPYGISAFLNFTRSPVGLVVFLKNFKEGTENDIKKELKPMCKELVERIRWSMRFGSITPANSARMQAVKGGNSPTYDTGDLSKALAYRVIRQTKSEGVGYFVGVPESAGFGANHPGKGTTSFWGKPLPNQQPKSLFVLAKMMADGFPVYHPKTKEKIMDVPPRDFLAVGHKYAQKHFAHLVKGSVVHYVEDFAHSRD